MECDVHNPSAWAHEPFERSFFFSQKQACSQLQGTVTRKGELPAVEERLSCKHDTFTDPPSPPHQNASYLLELRTVFTIHATTACTTDTATSTSGRGHRRPAIVVDNTVIIAAVSNTPPRKRRSWDPSEPRFGASPVSTAAAAAAVAVRKSRLSR